MDADRPNAEACASLSTRPDDADARYRQRVRRCFMNGKPCIFCNSLLPSNTDAAPESDVRPSPDPGVFVVMPFRPNLDTFYEWSLKNYLKEGLGIRDEKQIRRADEFRNIGYIMCEKICRRIQEADLIVVDLSLDNPNVFYELGLAVGLNKRLLLICDESEYARRQQADGFWHSIGVGVHDMPDAAQVVVKYPNVGFLSIEKFPPEACAMRVPLGPLKPKMNIVPLLVPGESPRHLNDDIKVGFAEALRGALGVAIHSMRTAPADDPSLSPRGKVRALPGVEAALESLDKEVRRLWSDAAMVPWLVDKPSGRLPSFATIAPKVDGAFACIVDLAGENPLSYFWLGYCHARGINVIPIFRPLAVEGASNRNAGQSDRDVLRITLAKTADLDAVADPSPRDATTPGSSHVLAFDLRALWYIDFSDKEVKQLASLLEGVLEELVARDVPRRQRNIFWERLTRESTVHIFTGAVHHPSLSREVVGDWDLRTVSELVRFLSSADESVIPELVRPMYVPETIRQKMGAQWQGKQSLAEYVKHIRDQLKDRNCLLIASADVNPVTEIALDKAYDAKDRCFGLSGKTQVLDRFTIALKGPVDQENPLAQTADTGTIAGTSQIRPFFSRDSDELKKDHRGFRRGANTLQQRYYSQDDAANGKEFAVLAHLVVMRNPFSGRVKDAIIVILNGVSGPGTYGLAEVLTGGTTKEKMSAAEGLLEDINDSWDKSAKRADFVGVEAIIKVNITPELEEANRPFSDLRGVKSWEWARDGEGAEQFECGPSPIWK